MMHDLQCNVVKSEDDFYYLEYKDSYYKINIYTYELLCLIKQGCEIGEIAFKMKVTESEIEEILAKINVIITSKKDNKKIKRILTLANDKVCDSFGRRLAFLAKSKWMGIVSLIAVLMNVLFYLVYTHFSLLFTDITVLHYLGILCAVMFVHEVGHVSAAYLYGMRGLKMKLGLFFIWPVFYVDMNKQILLQPLKRIKISLGGVYFQLVFSIFIIFFFYCSHNYFFLLLLNVNNFIVIVNLMPILVLDGYWVYSDIIGIDNLNKKSSELIYNSFRNIRYLKKTPLKLSIYAFARLFAICLIVFYVIKLLFYRFQFTLDIWYLLHEGFSFTLILRVIWWALPFILLLTYIVKKTYGRYSRNS